MELDQQDQDIIKLLTRLKDTDGAYPEHMLVARRRSFLKQMTEVGLGVGTAKRGRNARARTKPPGASSLTSILLETALIAVIAIEISAMAYFYRDQLTDLFRNITATSGIQEVPPPPVMPTSQEVNPSPDTTSTASSVMTATDDPSGVTGTLTSTPVPGDAQAGNQLNSTPDPNGNNGHHYGQTPKPERTKENNGGGGGNDNNGDKDPKPTKDK